MRRLAGAACAIGLALTGAARANCTLKQTGELPLTMERGRILVDAEINGAPVKMLIDTGSEATSLYRESADKLGLRATQVAGVKMYGAGGGGFLYQVGIKEFKVGAMVAKGMNMAVTGRRHTDIAAGLLGAGFLFQDDVEFDVPDGKLRFFRPAGCSGDQVVYWGKAYAVVPNVSPNPDLEIQVDTKLGEATIRTLVDSGASTSVVDPTTAERYANHEVAAQQVGKSYGLGKEAIDTSVAIFPSFSFGDETIRNAKLDVADLFHADREAATGSRFNHGVMIEPQLLLGADFFRSHRVYISKTQRKIYASYVGGPVFDTRRTSPAPPTTADRP